MHSGLKFNRGRGLAAVLAVSAGLCIVGPAAPASGQVSAFEYWGSRLGSNQTVTVNGLRLTRLPTGSVSVTRVSDGLRVIYSSNGISRFDMTDGRTLFRYPDGKQAIFSPNGTRQVFWPGGARSTYRADGREEHLLADGRYIVRPTTGPITQTETWPNGTRIYTYGEGTKVTFFPNGTKRTELSNGTVITSSWGNTGGSSGGGSGGGGGQPAPTIPAAPGGLVVTADPGGGFAMSWADNSDNEQKFVIERQPPFLSGTREVGANVIDYVDQTNLQTAQYRVAAANAAGTSEFTGWASVGSPSSDFPILQPGGGFAGPTPQPAAVGNPQMPGYDAKAIARWDVVPYQTFDGDLHIGVVAFHMNGIDRVEFSVDGGPWTPVYEMKLNPHSDVWEYTATLRASLFADGPVEVRAIAWPAGAGEPRVLAGPVAYTGQQAGNDVNYWYGPELVEDKPTNSLWIGEHSLELFANAGGSLVDQVYELPAGEYTWGEGILGAPAGTNPHPLASRQYDTARWIEFRAAPGVDPADVVITGNVTTRPHTDAGGYTSSVNYTMVRLRELTLRRDSADLTYMTRGMLWLDSVRVQGSGWDQNHGGFNVSHGFFTDTVFADMRSGSGYSATRGSGYFVRGCRFERIGEKSLRAAYFVANTQFLTGGYMGSGWHPSSISNPLVHDNRIYYNLTHRDIYDAYAFRSETWNLYGHRDVVIAGSDTESRQGLVMHLGGTCDNLYILNSRFTREGGGVPLSYRDMGPSDPRTFSPRLVVFENFVLNDDPNRTPQPHPLAGVIWKSASNND